MSDQSSATKSGSRTWLIVAIIIVGVAVLCMVLNLLGANSSGFTSAPTEPPPLDVTAAVEHVATVFTKWYGSTSAATAGSAGSAASPASETSIAAPGPAKVGSRIDAGPFALTLDRVETATAYGDRRAQAGNTFVVATLFFESHVEGGLNIWPDSFTLQDANGATYSTTLAKAPWISSGILLPNGQTMSCYVSFEVPEGARGLVMTYNAAELSPPVRVPFSLGF